MIRPAARAPRTGLRTRVFACAAGLVLAWTSAPAFADEAADDDPFAGSNASEKQALDDLFSSPDETVSPEAADSSEIGEAAPEADAERMPAVGSDPEADETRPSLSLASDSATDPSELPRLLRERDVAAFPATSLAPLTRIGFVIAGIGALGWGVSTYARRRRIASGVDLARIDVLAVKSLGAAHRLAVVEVGDRRLLIGMGKETICSIADLNETPAFEDTLHRELPAEKQDDGKQLLQSIGRFEGLDV